MTDEKETKSNDPESPKKKKKKVKKRGRPSKNRPLKIEPWARVGEPEIKLDRSKAVEVASLTVGKDVISAGHGVLYGSQDDETRQSRPAGTLILSRLLVIDLVD
jgi:hypothetical protein